MALLDDIGTYVAANTSLVLGTSLFLSLMPDESDNLVGLYENTGIIPVSTLGSSGLPKIERPELQFIVRNTSYATGRALSNTLWELLTSVANQTLSGTFYHRIEATSSPFVFERDISRRVLFSCNFNVMKELG